MSVYNNPIIPGFHPDPSICKVGGDYFLVNSSFGFFPGVPLFHSRDLVHWRQIGYCLDRPEQLQLSHIDISGGIFAPTIRYHNGTFYMITTNVSSGGNFYVTTNDPFASWSDPIWVEQGGIDPSLLFDGDHVYLTSTGIADPEQKMQGIIQSEIDITTGKLLTKPELIWTGTGDSYPEGPHLYRIDDRYYLMIAQGGTEYGHTEVIARSDHPWGPWEECPHNPILTHRSHHSPIQALGHADMVQAHDGSWWAVCLGIRPNFPQVHHLGRETFLVPVQWDENGWPYMGSGGRINLEMEAPKLASVPWQLAAERDDFNGHELTIKWNFLGTPQSASYSLDDEPGVLCLYGSSDKLDDGMGVTFIGCRQEHFNCEVATALRFSPGFDGEEAGITLWKDSRHHYDMFVTADSGIRTINVRRRIGSLSSLVATRALNDPSITLIVRANRLFYTFAYRFNDKEEILAFGETRYLSTEVAGGLTGVYFGLYASGNGQPSSVPASFDWFDYRKIETPGLLSIDSTVMDLLKSDEAKTILNKYFPELVSHPPAGWGANLSLLNYCTVSSTEVPTDQLILIDTELRAAGIGV